ncbi:MAG: Rpn family recombination-promoting nuclease/putative transposase, partial [Synergistaceae bacterium]|nr:Rpn family recombination-promoting nuclease/putative transposase [Synergistaceae bacterium]
MRNDIGGSGLSPEELQEYEELRSKGMLPLEIDRKRDRYFKFLFGTLEHKVMLLDLLNTALVLMGYEPLADITLVDRELSPYILDGKGLRLDLVGRTVDGRTVNLELQRDDRDDFVKRALYNSATIVHRQLSKGDDYSQLCQTIFVGIVDFTMFEGKSWYWDYVLSHPETGRVLTTDLLLIFVEMKKLKGQLDELRHKVGAGTLNPKDLLTRLALWGGYISNQGVDLVEQVQKADPVFQQVMKAEQDYWGDSRNRFLQMLEERAERDSYSALQS